MKMLVLTQEKAQKRTAKGEKEENMSLFRDSLILNGLKLILKSNFGTHTNSREVRLEKLYNPHLLKGGTRERKCSTNGQLSYYRG